MASLTKASLQYLGAIRAPENQSSKIFPTSGSGVDGLNYSQGPFCLDFQRNEIVVATNGKRVVRLNLVRPQPPRYMTSGDTKLLDRSSVPVATYVDGVMIDPANRTWKELNKTDNLGDAVFEGLQVLGDRLLIAGSPYYDANHDQDVSFSLSEWPVTTPRAVSRTPWRSVAGLIEGIVSGPVAIVPEKWRTALKGDFVSGQSSLPIISRQSLGPCAVAMWANDLLTIQDIPATMLVGYPYGTSIPGGQWGGPASDLFNGATAINGIAFVGDELVFVGLHGYGAYCYGDGNECKDPAASAKGTHAYPYRVQAWIYKCSDLAEVAAGRKKPHELLPRWFQIDFPIFEHHAYKLPPGTIPLVEVNGCGYDSEAGELYVAVKAQDSYGWEPGPLIHVYKNLDAVPYPNPLPTGSTAPTPPPPQQKPLISLNASPAKIQAGQSTMLSWQSTGADSVEISDGVGFVAAIGSKSVTPSTSTAFVAKAKNAAGETTAGALVEVTAAPPPPPQPPQPPTIGFFRATPSTVVAGSQVTLEWDVVGATAIEIEDVAESLPANGVRTVTPSASRAYTLSATNAAGIVTRNASIVVDPAVPQPEPEAKMRYEVFSVTSSVFQLPPRALDGFRFIRIRVETASLRVRFDAAPTATLGWPMTVGSERALTVEDARLARFIRSTSTTGKLHVESWP